MLRTADGSILRSADLVGAQLRLTGGAVVRIDCAVLTGDSSGRRWWAHDLSVQGPGGGWQSLCAAHVDGTQYAIVLPGREKADGYLANDPDALAVSCTSGALAKCLRLGYEPWQRTPEGGSMRNTYNACVRMIRADYTGLGTPMTEKGRQVDVHDTHGIQEPDVLPEHEFEAGRDEGGALCIHHMRVAGKVSREALESEAPRLRGSIGAPCTEAFARAKGALVFNRSAVAH